jgi:hypothetical protein
LSWQLLASPSSFFDRVQEYSVSMSISTDDADVLLKSSSIWDLGILTRSWGCKLSSRRLPIFFQAPCSLLFSTQAMTVSACVNSSRRTPYACRGPWSGRKQRMYPSLLLSRKYVCMFTDIYWLCISTHNLGISRGMANAIWLGRVQSTRYGDKSHKLGTWTVTMYMYPL